MADNQTRIQTYLDFLKGNQSGLKAIQDAEKAQSGLNKTITQGNAASERELKKLTTQQDKFNKTVKDAARQSQIDTLAQQYGELARNEQQATAAAADLLTQLEKIGATESELEAAARSFSNFKSGGGQQSSSFSRQEVGDISTASGAIGSALGSVGGAGGQQAGALVGDITGAIEYLPALKDSVVSFATAAGPAGLAVAAVAVSVGAAVAQIVSASKAMDQQIAATIQANADIEREIASGLTLEGAQAEIERLTQAREAELQIIEREKQAREDATAAARAAGPLGRSVQGLVNVFSEAEDASARVQAEAEANSAKFTAEIDRLNQAIAEGEVIANDTAEALEAGASTQVDAFREVQNLIAGGLDTAALDKQIDDVNNQLRIEAAVREQLAASVGKDNDLYRQSEAATAALNAKLGELSNSTTKAAAAAQTAKTALENDAGKALTSLADLAKNVASGVTEVAQAELARQAILASAVTAINNAAAAEDALAAKRAQTDSRAAEDAGVSQARAQAQLNQTLAEQAQQQADKLVDIEQSGAAKVADLRTELAEGVDNYYRQIAASNDSFYADQQKAEDDFNREQKRAKRDYLKEQARLERDARASQLDALLNNDFAAIIASQQEADTQSADLKDDFKDTKGDAKEDFAVEQQREAEAHEQKIADIEAELLAFQASTQQKIAATQAETAAELAQQAQAFADQQTKEAERRATAQRYADEDASLRAKRLAEDRASEDAAADTNLQKELERITEKSSAEVQAQVDLLAAVTSVDSAVVGLIAKAQTLATQAANAASSAATPPGVTTIPAFANEGLIPKDGVYRAGDVPPDEQEAIFRFKKSEGLGDAMARRSGGAGSTTIQIASPQISVSVGDVASMAQVRAEVAAGVNEGMGTVVAGVEQAIYNGRALKGAGVG